MKWDSVSLKVITNYSFVEELGLAIHHPVRQSDMNDVLSSDKYVIRPQAPKLRQAGCFTPGVALGNEMSLVSQVLVTSLLASYCGATLEVLLALQTHFRSGCVYLLQSHNTTG